MNRYQRIAWFNLIVIVTAVVATSIAVVVEFHLRGYSTIGFWAIGILALLQLTPHLFKKSASPGAVVSDERDELILKNAVARAWMAFWWAFVAVCFVLFLLSGPRNSVPTITLPLLAIAAGLFLKVACSVAILIQYSREGGRHE